MEQPIFLGAWLTHRRMMPVSRTSTAQPRRLRAPHDSHALCFVLRKCHSGHTNCLETPFDALSLKDAWLPRQCAARCFRLADTTTTAIDSAASLQHALFPTPQRTGNDEPARFAFLPALLLAGLAGALALSAVFSRWMRPWGAPLDSANHARRKARRNPRSSSPGRHCYAVSRTGPGFL